MNRIRHRGAWLVFALALGTVRGAIVPAASASIAAVPSPPAIGAPAAIGQQQDAVSPQLETGRELTGMFFGRQLDTLWERFSDELRQALDAQGGLLMFRDLVEENLGDEAHVLDDYVAVEDGMHLYVRQSIFQNYGETVELRWLFDDDGVVHGFEVVPG